MPLRLTSCVKTVSPRRESRSDNKASEIGTPQVAHIPQALSVVLPGMSLLEPSCLTASIQSFCIAIPGIADMPAGMEFLAAQPGAVPLKITPIATTTAMICRVNSL